MINNNTQQNTNVNTGTVSESSIYLKKSELPKDISSFRNDVGYISSSALSTWMKEHSYLSKNEITALINKANLVVIDTVNNSADSEAIERLNQDISDVKGEIVAIKDRLVNVETGFISIDKESGFATKGDVKNISNKVNNLVNDVSQININISQFASKDEIPNITGLASKQWVESKNYLTEHQSLSGYAKKSDIPNTAEFITKKDIPSVDGLASKQWVEDKNYLTEHQSLTSYAEKSDIPSLTGYA